MHILGRVMAIETASRLKGKKNQNYIFTMHYVMTLSNGLVQSQSVEET